MRDPKTMPVVRVQFTLSDGEVLARDWTMSDPPPDLSVIPEWLDDPRKDWIHPQDPVTFYGRVKAGFENEARAFVRDAS